MQTIRDLFIYFSLLSLSAHPHFLLANTVRGNESDYEALLAIKAEISSDPNLALSSWNNSLHFCRWEGITCGRRHQRVASLDLSSSKLVGTLSPFIGNLSFLQELNLTDNFFRGDIPYQISHLSRLRMLSLGKNSLEGEIPTNLSSCLHLNLLFLQGNNLVGNIPTQLVTLPYLTKISLSNNNLSGDLQAIGFGNISTSLQVLSLNNNQLQGSIPDDIGRFKSLGSLGLGDNLLSGTIPTSLFNLSSLNYLYLSNTNINGYLPQDLGLLLPQLQNVLISNTELIGQVPVSLSNLSELVKLDISFNYFKGRFPINGNNSPHLSGIYTQFAFSPGGEARDLSFLDTLTNCTNLVHLLIGGNSFTGSFPRSILNLSNSLELFGLYSNQISGRLPLGLGKFVNLYGLDFHDNYFIGPIPADIGNMETLELLYLFNNNFSEEIPSSMGNLTRLSLLSLDYNNLEGSLPRTLENCVMLGQLSLTYNNLVGNLPVELFRASNLFTSDISQNKLEGSLPTEISNLKNLVEFDVSQNRFFGEIPSTLGGCTSLTILNMSGNSFFGSIPDTLSSLKSIHELDLSCNNFSGHIPSYLSSWPYLSSLNLSFNNFVGEVPTQGVFGNTSLVSVVGNDKLCGGVPQLHLPRCHPQERSKGKRSSLAMIVTTSISGVLIVISSVALCFYLLCSPRKRKDASSGSRDIKPFPDVSYQMLSRATDGFSPSNLIGVGGFGSVYKGILHQDGTQMVVAIKVMNLQKDGARKSFLKECEALREIRHRNLVKIITACSSIDAQRNDFKALVYEFMPMGSLEGWLYSNLVTSENVGANQSCSFNLFERLSVLLDVACALEYLHTECGNPIIHCDLKPTNILLDDEMVAHVSDFGLAKFLSGASSSSTMNQTSSTQVRGVGFVEPDLDSGEKGTRGGSGRRQRRRKAARDTEKQRAPPGRQRSPPGRQRPPLGITRPPPLNDAAASWVFLAASSSASGKRWIKLDFLRGKQDVIFG